MCFFVAQAKFGKIKILILNLTLNLELFPMRFLSTSCKVNIPKFDHKHLQISILVSVLLTVIQRYVSHYRVE